ncbi:MAG: hypothetical protein Q7T82_17245 [Armatimonadota bacterium]|nr:hypothetical protein [Armatimonadota bacterium]
MVSTASEITELHNDLEQCLQSCLGFPVTLRSDAAHDWTAVRLVGNVVNFELVDSTPRAAPVFAETLDPWPRQSPVVPLVQQEEHDPIELWAGWHEKWLVIGEARFELESAAWSFYRGSSHVNQKERLICAHWDCLLRGRTPPVQPHWHFDREQLGIPYAPVSGGSLEELPGSSAQNLVEVNLSGMHLGMAWTLSKEHPECWQNALDISGLGKWAEHTLKLAQQEFPRRVIRQL